MGCRLKRYSSRRRRSRRGQGIELEFQLAPAAQTHHLLGDLAVLEEKERGDGLDLVLHGQILVLVNVDLSDSDTAVVLDGEFVQDRHERLAGAAPFSPEINEDRLFRL